MGELGLLMPDFHSLCLNPGKALPIDSRAPAICTTATPGLFKHVLSADFIIQRIEAISWICLRFDIQRSL
jgi:hypothetical protein